ncbi:hypothetical protein DLAC_10937 [Tieghemostelium lacteum]|uniref:Transmembrane protein n=1 Tax=Tieghemostelium lacteum TaxID=361077 RepID=A0A151Z2R4_TIELA|nr:hypothetical protein DLAC_10937 [Tieghemostelium lacteum]|eukprot:KYQ88246.1 hypothetical protein DLAC_10937 [Tieghemostelium lacteum]
MIVSSSSKIKKAGEAFANNDIEVSKLIHDAENRKEPHKEESGEFIKSIVFGGLDGIITTFAIVAAATGAGLTRGVILIISFANLLGDAIGMAMGDYVSEKAEEDHIKKETLALEAKLQEQPDQEKRNLAELYEKKGFEQEDANRIAELLFPYRKTVVSIVMMENHGSMVEDEGDNSALKSAAVTFISFMICGGIPLFAYLFSGRYHEPGGFDLIFIISIILFSIVLFGLGCFKGYISNKNWWISGFLMLLNGSITTLVAFFIGYGIEIESKHIH